jgi:uncharacterized protein YjiS (DUF1127 family)
MREAASFIASQTETVAGGFIAGALRFARAMVHSWKHRSDLALLRDFDDHQLADIGITREDLSWALTLPFSHDPTHALEERALCRRRRGWRE